MHSRRITAAFWTLGILLALYTAIGILGCEKIRHIDEAIWSPGVHTPEEVAAGKAPPIVEGIATALALLGYGGLAAWIRRSNKHGAADLETLHHVVTTNDVHAHDALADLSIRLDSLEKRTNT